MDGQRILAELDAITAEGNRDKVEEFLIEQCRRAEQEGDWGIQIMLNNEMMGFYRTTSQTKQAIKIFQRTKEIFMDHGLIGTVPYASTLQNAANAYRVDGQLEEAIVLFEEALEIYEKYLEPGDYRFAGLFNNLSLLYLEKGETWRAREYSERALAIIEKLPDTTSDQATNHVNLANLYCQTGELSKAREHLVHAEELFEQLDMQDPHISSLWSAWGQVHLADNEPEEAEADFRRACEEVEKYFGKSRPYATVTRNLALALERQGKADEAREAIAEAEEVMKALGLEYYAHKL